MTPSERRRRFAAEIRRQLRRRGRAIDEGVIRLIATLVELQEATRQRLAATPTEFEAHRLPEWLAEIDRHIDAWARRAAGELESGLEAAWERGGELVRAPLAAAGVEVPRTILPDSLLEEVKDYATRGMRDLGPLAKRRIEETVRRAVLGGKSPHEAMQEIGASLSRPGPLRFISFRAETIYRTEVGRLHSMAADRRLREAARVVSGLGKEWLWSGKSRLAHSAANGQKRAADEKFLVAGEELRFPRDPEGSPANTINCGCESIPYKADWS